MVRIQEQEDVPSIGLGAQFGIKCGCASKGYSGLGFQGRGLGFRDCATGQEYCVQTFGRRAGLHSVVAKADLERRSNWKNKVFGYCIHEY